MAKHVPQLIKGKPSRVKGSTGLWFSIKGFLRLQILPRIVHTELTMRCKFFLTNIPEVQEMYHH
jgi:hypothetical protein